MLPLETLDRLTLPDGREVVLYHRDGVFQIRVDGLELMTNRAHGSEEEMARLARNALGERPSPRVLVGGLGMGYTVRASLQAFGSRATVVVAEVLPAVVEWNRGPLAHLAGRPLDDPRVEVDQRDVADVIAAARFDAILLDVDNGPDALTLQANSRLYGNKGIAAAKRSLSRGGGLSVWSAAPDDGFLKRLSRARFRAWTESLGSRGRGKGPRHTIFMAVRK